MNRLLRAALLVLGPLLTITTLPARAENYPSRPITLIVPFAPGGGGDIIARLLAQKMSTLLPQQVVVENRPGAGGIPATQYAAKASPDGYSLLLLSNVNAISQSMFKSLPYDIFRDFIPISVAATSDVAVIVGKKSRYQSLNDFIRDAKERPNRLTVGIGLIGTTQHLSAELFKSRAGVEYTIVPFKSVANILTALNSGDVDASFELVPASIGYIKNGSLKALAIGSNKRFAGLPDVPTVAEMGIKNYDVISWAEVAAPAGTPKPVVDYLSKEILRALASTDLKDKYQELGLTAAGTSPSEASKFLHSEVAKWRDVIRTAGIEQR